MIFIKMGRYFGYPECCIADFVRHILKYREGKADGREKRKLHGTGYVPCAKCNRKSERTLIATIRKNRICKYVFPAEPSISKVMKDLKTVDGSF